MALMTFPLQLSAFFHLLPISTCRLDLPEALDVSETAGGELITADLGTQLWSGQIDLSVMLHHEAAAVRPLINLLRRAGATQLGAFLLRAVVSVGLSLLSRALQKKPRTPGLVTEATTSGGTTPQRLIVGLYATAGHLIAPPNSYGSVGSSPRAYLVYPIALSILPGITLQRVIVNDAYIDLSATRSATWGFKGIGPVGVNVAIDFLDGTQTVPDADMLAAFGTDPDRPWLVDMVGPGLAWVKARFTYDREAFNGLPSVRFEVMGIPLYDPRLDSSAGGAGPQRFNLPATWVQTANPAVIIYNILRGLRLADDDVCPRCGRRAARATDLAAWRGCPARDAVPGPD